MAMNGLRVELATPTEVALPLADGRWIALGREAFFAAVARGAELRLNSANGSAAPPPTERLVSSAELAELLGCNDTLIEQMARDRRIPAVRIGRLLRFEPAAVLTALRANGVGGE
jgi:excisionase family DNA binding protein